MTLTVPKGFNQRINETLVNYSNLLNSKDKIMYILSLITCSDFDKESENTPTFKNTLYSKSIIKRVGKSKSKGFKTIIDFLVKENFIEKSKNHYNGKFCREYTIIQLENGLTETYNVTDSYFINRGRKVLAKKLNYIRPETEAIRENITQLELPIEIRQKYNLPTKFFHQKDVTEFCSYNNITEHITEGRSGRVFNAISGMKKDLRHCFVHSDGSNLSEIDITSAQYYFISVDMMANEFTDLNLNNDLAEGKFYENLMSELKYKGTRDEFKVYLQSNYFNINVKEHGRNEKIDLAITNLYPNMKNYINMLDSLDEFDFKYKTIGTYAQRLESNMMIEFICNDLIQNDLFVVSIHDALLVKEQDVEKVKTIMQNHLEPHCNMKTVNFKDLQLNHDSIEKYINRQVPTYKTFIEVGELGSIRNFKSHCKRMITYLETNNIEVNETNLLKYSKAPVTVVKKVLKEIKPNQNQLKVDQNFMKVHEAYNLLLLRDVKKITAAEIINMTELNKRTVAKYLKQILDSNV